jgi:ribosomal protein S18 acetylase RimI-like enzyme
MHSLNATLALELPDLTVTFRSETTDDIEFLAHLYALTRADELTAVDWPEATKQAFCRQQFTAQRTHYLNHYPGAQLLIIQRGVEPVGRVYFEQTAHELRLMEITLVPAARNLGIGGAVGRALQRRAHEAGLPITLHVEPFNPARRLYERQGFREVETRGLYLYMVSEPPAAL